MKIRILKKHEIVGKDRIGIIKEAIASDYAICTGASYINNNLEDKMGEYTLMTVNNGSPCCITSAGYISYIDTWNPYIGVRPVIEFESCAEINNYGIRLGDNKWVFGMYMDYISSKDEQEKWSKLLKDGALKNVGEYTTDTIINSDPYKDFHPMINKCYEDINGNKVVILKAKSFDDQPFKLSNGEEYKDGDYVYFNVKPFCWDLDEEHLLAISPKVIFGGIQFDYCSGYCSGNTYISEKEFSKTFLGKYLNEVFLPELTQFTPIIDNYHFAGIYESCKNPIYQDLASQYIKSLNRKVKEYKSLLGNIGSILNIDIEKVINLRAKDIEDYIDFEYKLIKEYNDEDDAETLNRYIDHLEERNKIYQKLLMDAKSILNIDINKILDERTNDNFNDNSILSYKGS